ncbi:hypothetical protein MMC22_000605 [Lobaria immixta]|nr:hypothetical protein [Lobaria immixta]
MSFSDLFTKREPPEVSDTHDQIANHSLRHHTDLDLVNQVQALTSSSAQPWYDTVPVDGDGKLCSSVDQGPDANGQSCPTTNQGDGSKKLEHTSQEDFVSSCKAWEKWYNVKQRDGQTVLQFTEYLQKVLASLPPHGSGEYSMLEQFHRLRSSLRDPIKAILDAQIIQPTTYDDVVNVALRIEEKEMNLLGHVTVSCRKPRVPLPPSKSSKQTPSSYRPKPGHDGYTSLQRAKLAPDQRARNLGPVPSRVSKRSRRRNHDIGIPRHHGLPLDQISIGDKNNNHCYICGKSNHSTSDCHAEGSKFFGALSFPVRSKVPENSLMSNSHWDT